MEKLELVKQNGRLYAFDGIKLYPLTSAGIGGARGSRGPTGPTGPTGPSGSAASYKVENFKIEIVDNGDAVNYTATITPPSGTPYNENLTLIDGEFNLTLATTKRLKLAHIHTDNNHTGVWNSGVFSRGTGDDVYNNCNYVTVPNEQTDFDNTKSIHLQDNGVEPDPVVNMWKGAISVIADNSFTINFSRTGNGTNYNFIIWLFAEEGDPES